MTTIWGADLGVRTVHLAGIDDEGDLSLASIEAQHSTGLVRDQAPWVRGRELLTLAQFVAERIAWRDRVFTEEPPLAGKKNPRTFLKLAQTSAAVAIGAAAQQADVFFVPVDSWKKGVVGRGSTAKDLVARWLERNHPIFYARCDGDQNSIDATCLAIYGRSV